MGGGRRTEAGGSGGKSSHFLFSKAAGMAFVVAEHITQLTNLFSRNQHAIGAVLQRRGTGVVIRIGVMNNGLPDDAQVDVIGRRRMPLLCPSPEGW